MTEVRTVHHKPQWVGKLYGVELEIEAAGLYDPVEIFCDEDDCYHTEDPDVPRGWLREQEDSIEGVELISNRPYSFVDSANNIVRVFLDIERQGYSPIRTPRGSTHVHANVADLTWAQMRHFVTACAWAEPALVELAGKGRKGNLFAQSYETTPIGWNPVIDWVRQESINQTWDTHYMGISFYPMSYLGSVEFRMGPSARNSDEAIDWLSKIDLVVDAGRDLPINASEEPSFMHLLTSQLDPKTRERVIAKGRRHAEEVWEAMLEQYIPPPQPRQRIKSAMDMLGEAALSHYTTEPTPTGSGWILPPPVTHPTHIYDISIDMPTSYQMSTMTEAEFMEIFKSVATPV